MVDGSNYFPSGVGNFGVLLVMPAGYNYVAALYIDSGANIAFAFSALDMGTWTWTVLPH